MKAAVSDLGARLVATRSAAILVLTTVHEPRYALCFPTSLAPKSCLSRVDYAPRRRRICLPNRWFYLWLARILQTRGISKS